MSQTSLEEIINMENSFPGSYGGHTTKRKISVRKYKLPKDFFAEKNTSKNTSICLWEGSTKQVVSTAQNSPREACTPSFADVKCKRRKLMSIEKRTASTARELPTNDESLIQDIIHTSRNLNRFIRKQSLELSRADMSSHRLSISKTKQSSRGINKTHNQRKDVEFLIDLNNINREEKLPKLPQIPNRRYLGLGREKQCERKQRNIKSQLLHY